MEKIHIDILEVMKCWDSEIERLWCGYNDLFDDCNGEYSIKDLKKTMKHLGKLGFVEYGPTYDYDCNILSGSGWFLRNLREVD